MLDASLSRAERLNPSIHAVVNINKSKAEQLIADTPKDAPLYGVPTLLKDLGAEAKDFPSHNGSRLYQNMVYSYDSSIYTRMQKTGLIPYARTTSPELGIGPTSEAGVYGEPTRNPWHLDHTSGGSSGGAAAAVAAGIVPLAHAQTVAGLSGFRLHAVGLWGLSQHAPVCLMAPALAKAGQAWLLMVFLPVRCGIARLCLISVQGLIGSPYAAPALRQGFIKSMNDQPSGLRIAVCDTDFIGNPVHEECRKAIAQTADMLRQLGHDVTIWSTTIADDVQYMMKAWTKIVAAGTLLSVRYKKDIDALKPDDVDGVTYGAVQLGKTVSGADYLQSINTIHAFGRKMAALFDDFDILLTPTLAEPPAQIGRFKPTNSDFMDYRNGPNGVFAYSPYTAAFNASGQPAISLPLHWTADHLPVGVHFAGAYGNDEILISLAAQCEEAMPWRDRQVDLIRQYHQSA